MSSSKPLIDPTRLRRAVLLVAGLNLAYFFIEGAIALAIGSVSLLADSVDFFEDFAVNTLIAIALGWSLTWQARAGKASALIILLPALAAVWQIVAKFPDPGAPRCAHPLRYGGRGRGG